MVDLQITFPRGNEDIFTVKMIFLEEQFVSVRISHNITVLEKYTKTNFIILK